MSALFKLKKWEESFYRIKSFLPKKPSFKNTFICDTQICERRESMLSRLSQICVSLQKFLEGEFEGKLLFKEVSPQVKARAGGFILLSVMALGGLMLGVGWMLMLGFQRDMFSEGALAEQRALMGHNEVRKRIKRAAGEILWVDEGGSLHVVEGNEEVLLSDNRDWKALEGKLAPKFFGKKEGYLACASIYFGEGNFLEFFGMEEVGLTPTGVAKAEVGSDVFRTDELFGDELKRPILDFLEKGETLPYSTHTRTDATGSCIGLVITGIEHELRISPTGHFLQIEGRTLGEIWNPYNRGIAGNFSCEWGARKRQFLTVHFFGNGQLLGTSTPQLLEEKAHLSFNLGPGEHTRLALHQTANVAIPAGATHFSIKIADRAQTGRRGHRPNLQRWVFGLYDGDILFQEVEMQTRWQTGMIALGPHSFKLTYDLKNAKSHNIRAPKRTTQFFEEGAIEQKAPSIVFHLPQKNRFESIAQLRQMDYLKSETAPLFQLHSGVAELNDFETHLWDFYECQKSPLYFSVNNAYLPHWERFLKQRTINPIFAEKLAELAENEGPFLKLSDWVRATQRHGLPPELLEQMGDTLSLSPQVLQILSYGQTHTRPRPVRKWNRALTTPNKTLFF